MVSTVTVPQKDERYVWEIPDVFGPLFLTVDHCVAGQHPRCFFTVHMSGGRTRRITRGLPLSPLVQRRDWADHEPLETP